MASASLGQGAGQGKKSLDAELNLVPFIDLLSMCICFLLITAVWIQIGAVQVKQSHGTDGAAQVKNEVELDLKLVGNMGWALEAKQGGKMIKKAGAIGAEALGQTLRAWIPGFHAPIANAMIHTRQEVTYGQMVLMMDALRKEKIVNLGVHPAQKE
jgi:biopolymer transport protein ExbD